MNQKEQILDISMNLNRIGNWAADDYTKKQRRIALFLDQTSDYTKSIDISILPDQLKKPMERFLVEYPKLSKEGKTEPKNTEIWAEKLMTWGNILSHRAQLLGK